MNNKVLRNVMLYISSIFIAVMTLLFVVSCDQKDDPTIIKPEWDRNHKELTITIHMFDTRSDMRSALEGRIDEPIDPATYGKAIMSPDDTVCEVYVTKPVKIDDDHTLTLGHEVLHCVLGRYHDE